MSVSYQNITNIYMGIGCHIRIKFTTAIMHFATSSLKYHNYISCIPGGTQKVEDIREEDESVHDFGLGFVFVAWMAQVVWFHNCFILLCCILWSFKKVYACSNVYELWKYFFPKHWQQTDATHLWMQKMSNAFCTFNPTQEHKMQLRTHTRVCFALMYNIHTD